MSLNYSFACGCKIPVFDKEPKANDGIPSMAIPYEELARQINYSKGCPGTWELMSEGRTKGVFQLETQLGQGWAGKLKPTSLEEISALVSIIRPGVLRALVDCDGGKQKTMTQLYVDRKHGVEEIKYFHDALEPIFRDTWGIMVYQEQAMRIAVELAGFNEQQADVLRKAIGKKKADIMAEVRNEFLEGCAREEIVNKQEAEQIFSWIQESQRYSFNHSHGIGYGSLGYLSMFAKFHFPLHFYCSWLKFARNKQDTLQEMKELVADAKMSDVLILPPSIDNIFFNHADVCVNDDRVNFGIKCIKKIGEASVKKFLARIRLIEGQLGTTIDKWTWLEFLANVGAKVNKTTVNNLISVGTFTKYGITRTQMLYDYEAYSKLTIKESDNVCKLVNTGRFENLTKVLEYFVTLEKKDGGPSTTPRKVKIGSIIDFLKKPPFSMQDKPAWILKQEKALIGTPISYSAIDTVNVKINTNTTCKEFKSGKSGSDLTVAVELNSVRQWTVKTGKNKGSVMAFATAEDNTGSIDCVIFSDGFHLYEHLLTEGNMVVLSGERSNKGSFQINKIFQI
jgi:DNA polymerase III subunit alpha